MKKSGMSAIVATILIILITIVAILILWLLLIPLLQQGLWSDTCDVDLVIDTVGGYTYFDANKGVACVRIKRIRGEANLTRVDVLFEYNGTTLDDRGSFLGDKVPTGNEMKSECFDMRKFADGNGGFVSPDSMRIVPVYFNGARRIDCSVSSVIGISSERGLIPSGVFPDDVGDLDSIDAGKGKGEECVDTSECTGGLSCIDAICAVIDLSVGEPCDDNGECASGLCADGYCAASPPVVKGLGETCEVGECDSGLECFLGACARSLGESCGDGSECASGLCADGECSVPVSNQINGCGVVLSDADTTYVLTGDISGPGPCITVAADNVGVNLDSRTITATGSGAGVYVDNSDGASVYGGNINGFNQSVYLNGSDGASVYGNVLIGDDYGENLGVYASYSDSMNIYGNEISGFYGGVLVEDNGVTVGATTIENNYINGTGGSGIAISDHDRNVNIISNDVNYSGDVGIWIGAADIVTIEDNELYFNIGTGIDVNEATGGSVSNNFVYETRGVGIYLVSGNMLVDGNEIYSSSAEGIYFDSAHGDSVNNNYINGSGGEGLRVGSDEGTFENNTITFNNGGVVLPEYGNDNSFINNTICGNDNYDFFCHSSNTDGNIGSLNRIGDVDQVCSNSWPSSYGVDYISCDGSGCFVDDDCAGVNVCSGGVCQLPPWITSISTCRTISSDGANFILSDHIVMDPPGGNCFMITGDNIVLNLDGWSVTGYGMTGYGVGVYGNNVTVKGAGSTDSTTGGSGGISTFSLGIYVGVDSSNDKIFDMRSCYNGDDVKCNGAAIGINNNFGAISRSCDNAWPAFILDHAGCSAI